MYQFYMDGVLLPVTPGAMTVKVANQNKTATLINEGEINILKLPGLSKISFSALLPNREYDFARYESGFRNAGYYLSVLERLKTSCAPFEFTVIRTNDSGTLLMDSQPMTVSLESYELSEDAEKYGDDVTAKIELLQYRSYGTKTLSFQQTTVSDASGASKTPIVGKTMTTMGMLGSAVAVATRMAVATVTQKRDASTKPKETSYTVAQGDNLWSIARTKLGDDSRASELYQLNQDVIEAAAKKYGRSSSSNGHWIYPGTVLRLPT